MCFTFFIPKNNDQVWIFVRIKNFFRFKNKSKLQWVGEKKIHAFHSFFMSLPRYTYYMLEMKKCFCCFVWFLSTSNRTKIHKTFHFLFKKNCMWKKTWLISPIFACFLFIHIYREGFRLMAANKGFLKKTQKINWFENLHGFV